MNERADGRRRARREFAEDAAVGIGTMIVFIATVLVAAIAAGVLIDMSGKLQSRSQATGEESTAQVASNLQVESIVGLRNNSTVSNLTWMHTYVALAPGAIDVDLGQMRIQIIQATSITTMNYSQAADAAPGSFIASAERDADGSFTTDTPTMTAGDLVIINITATENNMDLDPRTEVIMKLIPEIGISVEKEFNAPNSFGSKTVVRLA